MEVELHCTPMYDFCDPEQRGQWIDIFVALVEYLRSGESKVQWLSASHPKNLIHKVFDLEKVIDWIFRIRKINMDLNFCRMMMMRSIWWIYLHLRTICLWGIVKSRRRFRIGLLRLKGVGRNDWMSRRGYWNCKAAKWILQIFAGVNLSKFLFNSHLDRINKSYLSVESWSSCSLLWRLPKCQSCRRDLNLLSRKLMCEDWLLWPTTHTLSWI